MDTKHLLVQDKSELLKRALNIYGKNESELTEAINTIKDWLKTQNHLPEIPSDNIITNFLFINKFSIEVSKQKIEMYYSIRTIIPEFYQNKNPKEPHMQRVLEIAYVIPLPKITPDGYRVTLFSLKTNDSDKFNYCDFSALTNSFCEIRLNEDISIGEVVVYDFKHATLAHLARITPTLLKKALFVLEKVYSNRLKQLHYINVPPYAETFLTLVRGMIKEKLAKRIFIHKEVSTLYDYIPKEVLPSDLGGDEISMQQLTALWKKKFSEYQDRFDTLEKMKVKEELRPNRLQNDEVLGFHGNFKKIEVD